MKSVSAEQISPGDLQGAPTVKVSMAAIDLLSPCDERISIEWNARRALSKFKISKRWKHVNARDSRAGSL